MMLLLFFLAAASAVNVTEYLIQYGYMNASDTALLNFESSLAEFQTRYNLPVDGKTNEETLRLMEKPRCGISDTLYNFRTFNSWNKTNLNWAFPVSSPEMRVIAEQAFQTWQDVSGLTFHYSLILPDILILIPSGRAEHTHSRNCIGTQRCSTKFDGPRGALAHGFMPLVRNNTFCREIHLDPSEKWYLGLDSNVPDGEHSLYATLIHEIGHTLGLSHSDVKGSLMYPWYGAFKLSEDDILAIQSLYPRPTTSPIQTTKQPTTPPKINSKNVCDLKIKDVHFLVANKRLYIIHQKYVWAMDLESKKFIRDSLDMSYSLQFLPTHVTHAEAIYQRPNGQIALFTKEFVYLFNMESFQLIEKKSLTNLLGSYYGYKIHGAVNTYTGRTFIFLDRDISLELDESTFTIIKHGDISSMFPGIPPDIDGVFRYTNGVLYFFKNGRYYEYDEFRSITKRTDVTYWSLFDVRCPHMALYDQLKILLEKILSLKPYVDL